MPIAFQEIFKNEFKGSDQIAQWFRALAALKMWICSKAPTSWFMSISNCSSRRSDTPFWTPRVPHMCHRQRCRQHTCTHKMHFCIHFVLWMMWNTGNLRLFFCQVLWLPLLSTTVYVWAPVFSLFQTAIADQTKQSDKKMQGNCEGPAEWGGKWVDSDAFLVWSREESRNTRSW